MSQPDDKRPAKLQKRKYATLASNLHDGTSVVIGHGVHEEVEPLSDLLSGLKNTDGLAPIPSSIKPEEFSLWQAASIVQVKPSTGELVSILKARSFVSSS